MADVYIHGFLDNVPKHTKINVAAAEIGIEGRDLRQRVSLGLQLTSARRQQTSVRGERGHEGGGKNGTVGDVFRT
jgi:hypothetical protein